MRGKRTALIIVIGALLIIVAAASALIVSGAQPPTTILLGDGDFKAQVATTPSQRQSILSSIASLSGTQALLLAYPTASEQSVSESTFSTPVDIVWLNTDKKIVSTARDVSASTNGVSGTLTAASVQYVVILPAGSIDHYAISGAQPAIFDISQKEIN